MSRNRRAGWILALVALVGMGLTARAGNLDSPATPASADSAMYTLEDIYHRLNNGTPGAKRTGAFVEPSAGPNSTGHSTDEIMGLAPALDETDGATPSQVQAGKKFWGLTSGAWGIQTGTKTAYNSIIRLPGAQAFGNVYTGDVQTVNVTIWNDGDCAMTVTGIEYSDNCFSGSFTGKVLAGSSAQFSVSFAPVLVQDYNGIITVQGDQTGGTNTIVCTGAGVVWSRFVDNGDGTVTDNATGLMWTKNANHGAMSWGAALSYCDNLETNGYSDWRLPSVNKTDGNNGGAMGDAELDTVGRPNGVPTASPFTMPGSPFTNVQTGYYWSRTGHEVYGPSGFPWYMTMSTGAMNYDPRPNTAIVWPVRGP